MSIESHLKNIAGEKALIATDKFERALRKFFKEQQYEVSGDVEKLPHNTDELVRQVRGDYFNGVYQPELERLEREAERIVRSSLE